MTYFPRLDRDWNNPYWQPKYFGGRRMSRKRKKIFNQYAFFWYDPPKWPNRWIKGTHPSHRQK